MPYMDQVLREVFRIEEMKDGAVYKTRSVGLRWVQMGAPAPDGWIYAAVSTDTARMLAQAGKHTIRRVEVDEDGVPCEAGSAGMFLLPLVGFVALVVLLAPMLQTLIKAYVNLGAL